MNSDWLYFVSELNSLLLFFYKTEKYTSKSSYQASIPLEASKLLLSSLGYQVTSIRNIWHLRLIISKSTAGFPTIEPEFRN